MDSWVRITGILLAAMTLPADAHDFWVQPLHWRIEMHEPLDITLQVGHGPARQRSSIPSRRIVRFETGGGEGPRVDLREALHVGAARADATIVFDQPGGRWIALETDHQAQSHLPAMRFNDYLRVEGLTPAIARRAEAHREDQDGAECYSRHAKSFVQVGPASVDAAEWSRRLGLELEIVPEGGVPTARGGPLAVRVYFHDEPLAGALVKLNDLDRDAEPLEVHRSDASGRAVFNLAGAGSWQLNVIWTEPQAGEAMTDFDTRFSSLAFGVTG